MSNPQERIHTKKKDSSKFTHNNRQKAKVSKGKKRNVDRSKSSDDDASPEGRTNPDLPLTVQLRPRPKRRKVQLEEEEEEVEEEGEEQITSFSYRKFGVGFLLLAIIIAILFASIPTSLDSNRDLNVTKTGYLYFTLLAIFLLLLGLDRGGNVSWHDRLTIGALCASAALSLLFVLVELRWAREPFAPRHIVGDRSLLASYLANLFSNAAAMPLIFSVSLYLQAVQGASASEVGLILLPTIFGGVSGSLATGLIMQATGKYYVLTIASFALMLIGNLIVGFVTGPLLNYTLLGLSIGAYPPSSLFLPATR